MKKWVSEFKNFAIKGNMIDMAIGIIIGASFNAIVNTLVKKIIMPPLGMLTGGINFTDHRYILKEGSNGADEIAIGYGDLFNVLVDFFIVALTIFLVVKGINKFRAMAEDPDNKTVETPKNIELLAKIEKLIEEQNRILKRMEGKKPVQ